MSETHSRPQDAGRGDICRLGEEKHGTAATSACSSYSMRGDAEMTSAVGKDCRLGGRWNCRADREVIGGESQCGFGFDGAISRRQTGQDTICGGE